MGQKREQTRMVHTWTRRLAVLVAFAVILLLSTVARAQSLNAAGWRANAAFISSNCYNRSANGGRGAVVDNCHTNICGQQVNIDNAGNVTIPSLGFNSATVNLGNLNQALQTIDTLGSLCGTGVGEGILATGGSTSVQNAQVENLARTQGRKASGVPDYSGGGVLEASSGTYGGSIPLSYGTPLSKDTAFSAVGFVSYANQGGITNQGAVSGSPAYSWQVRDGQGNRLLGVAAYVPLSIAFASVSGAPDVVTVWGGGAGAIASGTIDYHAMTLTYGAGAAFRVVTNGQFALPISILARADEPLEVISPLLKGFISVSYGNDYLNGGTEIWVLGTGASFGKYEIGYRGYYGSSVVSHTLGFSIRKELIGAAVLEHEVEPEEEKKPAGPTPSPAPGPTPPVGPNGPEILQPGPAKPPPPLPPPPEVPQLPPECQTDADCPGDEVCEEARCLSPL